MAKKNPTYKPTKEVQEARTQAYACLEQMLEVKNQTYPQFNDEFGDHTLATYVEQSDKRMNAHTPPREAQDKEAWQSNIFDPVTRNKLKAIVAAVAFEIPEFRYKAVNKQFVFSRKRAGIIKQLVRHSRLTAANPRLELFYEAWGCAGRGTIIKYDGYLKTKYKRKYVTSYDPQTGKVEWEEREETVDDRPVDVTVPLSEFFVWDFYIEDVQEQPRVAWVQHLNRRQLEQEFAQFPNVEYVRDKQTVGRFSTQTDAYFYEKWQDRAEDEDDYEVVRIYDKENDSYEIWANGVVLLRAPLLWGKRDKQYPFAKTIFEPFAGRKFFYGMSLPWVLMGMQDSRNATVNTITDKLYRSLVPPMLVGLANKDLLDVEDELVNQDSKIYVPDVNQVKPMPYPGVGQGDLTMMEVFGRMMDLASVDITQQGVAGRGVTAREIMLSDRRAKELQGIFFMFLEELWRQKERLRINTILTHYTQPRIEKIVGAEGKESIQEALTVFNVPDVEFDDGKRGTLGIQIASKPDNLMTLPQIEAREELAEREGVPFKIMALTSDYLDDWEYDFEMIPESLEAKNQALEEARVREKIEGLITIFPEYVANPENKQKLFGEYVGLYDESAEEYQPPVAPPAPGAEAGADPLAEAGEIEAMGQLDQLVNQ